MNDSFENRTKNYKDYEKEDLKIENFKPLSNKNKDNSSSDPLTMEIQKSTLKKSASYIIQNYNKAINLEEDKKNNKDFITAHKTNSKNSSYLFNNNINFTSLNEGDKSSFLSNKNSFNGNKIHKISLKLYSKDFSKLIKTNDFSPDLGKYDKKIILTLNNKVKELEDKLVKALDYYYKMENECLKEIKIKKQTEKKLNKSIKDLNIHRSEYDKSRQINIAINNSLLSSRNEIDRLIQTIKEEQKIKLEKKEDFNNILIKEENERKDLETILRANDSQILILEDKINFSKLTNTMKAQKIKEMVKSEKNEENYKNIKKKNDEIENLKNTIKQLQKELNNLQNELKKGKENKKKLIEEIKFKNRKKKFNNNNISLLYQAIEKQKEDEILNNNLLKAKNIIIKNMNNRANGVIFEPHYFLPKNVRINSAQKPKNFEYNFLDN